MASRVRVFCLAAAAATGAVIVAVYVRRRARRSKIRRGDGDDDSGVEVDKESEASLRESDVSHDDVDGDPTTVIDVDAGQLGVPREDAEMTISRVSQSEGTLSAAEARALTSVLTTSDLQLQEKALVSMANAAAFEQNLSTLREAGCLTRLSCMLQMHTMALRVGHTVAYPSTVTRIVNTITNLAAGEDNQEELQDCIPALIELARSDQAPESVQISSLQALINLSVTRTYHPPYTQLIQRLYERLDRAVSRTLQLHALKVLINLAANPDMVPHLLAAKAPSSLLATVVPSTEEDYLLRWVTLLANIMWKSKELKLTSTCLPTEYKAPSPETMWTAIYGLNTSAHLRSKMFVLSKHPNQEIRYHAARIYSCLG